MFKLFRYFSPIGALTILAVTAVQAIKPATAKTVLDFGVYVADKPTEVVRQFRPVLSALEVALSKKLNDEIQIRMQVAHSYEIGIEDLTKGRVDFSRFGPASYVVAKGINPDITLLAMESV